MRNLIFALSLMTLPLLASVQETFNSAVEAYENKSWPELLKLSEDLTKNYAKTPFGQEAHFFLAVSYYNLKQYEPANKQFTAYLKSQATPKHFEEAIEYKFAIAEQFKAGERKHIMGMENLPKWISAREDAIAIYDEVITALPHHDMGARALLGKATLLFKEEEFKSSIETYQTLIRRFPKHPLAVESFIGIGEIYFTQSRKEYTDPDFLDLAEINMRKFKTSFPLNEKIVVAEKILLQMKELYAKSLYETAQFYERTNKAKASLIYYSQLIAKYPDTKLAELSKERLEVLKK